jgi:two-component system, OmpR family, KDP operon response regulator KdpE
VIRGGSRPLARVLLADDDPGVLRGMEVSLSRAGFEVTAVDDGAPAIALAGSSVFELVVVDLHMKTSGLAVIGHYKQRYGAGVYCAVLSGDDDEDTRETCLAAGADDVFVKPLLGSALRRRLTEAALALRAEAEPGRRIERSA